jgi:hypothetical protein
MKDTIYISGPVSELDYNEAFKAFAKAETTLRRKFGKKVGIVNPMMIVPKGSDWYTAMRICIKAMMDCNYIHLLPGFEKSKGARRELALAEWLKFGVCNDQYELVNYDEGDGKKN